MRQHWLRRRAEESATFHGALRSLSERGAPVEVGVAGAAPIAGQITGTGRELIELSTPEGPTWLAVARIESLSTPVPAVADDDRVLEGGRSMAGLLSAFAAERHLVEILAGGSWLGGQLVAAGTDVVTLRAAGRTALVPTAGVAAVRLPQSPGSG